MAVCRICSRFSIQIYNSSLIVDYIEHNDVKCEYFIQQNPKRFIPIVNIISVKKFRILPPLRLLLLLAFQFISSIEMLLCHFVIYYFNDVRRLFSVSILAHVFCCCRIIAQLRLSSQYSIEKKFAFFSI